MIQGNQEFQVDEVEWSKKGLEKLTFFDFDVELLSDNVKDPNALSIDSFLFVIYTCFERLYLELLSSSSRQFHVYIFIEHDWEIVEISTLHFFPAVYLELFLLFRVEIETVA